MNDYEKQANDFLTATGSTVEARYKERGIHFLGDKDTRDIWEIRIRRGARSYSFDYGASINDRDAWDKEITKHISPYSTLNAPERIKRIIEKAHDNERDWQVAGSGHRPTAYDILACMDACEPPDNVNDFAAAFGFEKPSVALATFNAVREQYNNLKMLFNDDEMQLLGEIS